LKYKFKLNQLSNIVEIGKYMNAYLSDDNLISMINDMILGILGVTYSTIFI
ncbi:Signal transduction protein containing diguanilate cyclase/phosphodiesterase protein, partial [human gut metagenome]